MAGVMFTPHTYGGADFQDTDWITLPLLNGWVDYGPPYAPSEYRRLNGVVYVHGLIKSGTTNNNTVVANLPVGFRPLMDQLNPAQLTSPGTAFCRIDVCGNGDLMGRVGLGSSWTGITLTPFIAEQ